MTFADAPDVLTVDQVVKLLPAGVAGRNGVYQAVKAGDLFAAKVGRRLVVPRIAVERWLLGPFAVEAVPETNKRPSDHSQALAMEANGGTSTANSPA